MPFVQRVVEPKFLSKTSLFNEDGQPLVQEDELVAVSNNTLANALRQLASLVVIADDIFNELQQQLLKVAERSKNLKTKIVCVEDKVAAYDPKKVTVPESDICTFAKLKTHYVGRQNFTTGLFTAETRSSAVQELYTAAARTPVHTMRQMDRWRRDGHRSSRFFVCTPVLGSKRRKIRNRVDIDIETRMPAAVEELRRWTSAEAIGDVTVAPDCSNRIQPNMTVASERGGDMTDATIGSDDEAIDHKLPSPEEQLQVIALKFPAEIIAVDTSGRQFDRMSIQRRSLLQGGGLTVTSPEDAQRRRTRSRKPRGRRRNTLAGTDQKEIRDALCAGDDHTSSIVVESESPDSGAVFRSRSSDLLRSKKDSPSSDSTKKSHFNTLKQWGKNRLKMINKSIDSKLNSSETNNKSDDIDDINIYETVTMRRRRNVDKEKKPTHERKTSYSSSEKSSVNVPITTSTTASIAVKLRESSAQRRLRRSGANKDEPHSSSGNWSASSESGRASIGSEITSTTHPKSTTSTATSNNSLNQHAPSSINSRRRFINTSTSSSVTSEGTLTPDIIHDLHDDGETSSVYSCDTEGYYTSFHMDSGLKTLKEEEMPITPLHSSSAFTNSSENTIVLTAENEYELFGKGSTSTTTSSAGTVCTTLRASESNRSLIIGPAVPERKSSLNKDKSSPNSSLERDFSSDKTGTVKRSPATLKATVVALVHKQNGDLSPDSGHNTSSSPIESINSPNGVRSGSEFEFSESSDIEGVDRIERIRVKTTINSSRIPSMCVITPPHSDDDESVHSNERNDKKSSYDPRRRPPEETNLDIPGATLKHLHKNKLELPLKPIETDLDTLTFADEEIDSKIIRTPINGEHKMHLVNVNRTSGYATVEEVNARNGTTNTNKRAASPSGGTYTERTASKTPPPPKDPIIKTSLLPFNAMFGKLKTNLSNLAHRRDSKSPNKHDANKSLEPFLFDSGEYVTIADVRNNNKQAPIYANDVVKKEDRVATLASPAREVEYVSLNELPCNKADGGGGGAATGTNLSDSLERKRRQGARVTLDSEGKVVYSSDSLRRRKGCHTTFEPGPFVKDVTAPCDSPLPTNRTPKPIRPVGNKHAESRPMSPPPMSPPAPLGKLIIKATSGMNESSTSEIVRKPPSAIVTPQTRPMSPKHQQQLVASRGAYVNMQTERGPPPLAATRTEDRAMLPTTNQPPMYKSPPAVYQSRQQQITDVPVYGYQNPYTENMSAVRSQIERYDLVRGNMMYGTLPTCRPVPGYNQNADRCNTPDITRGLNVVQNPYKSPTQNTSVNNSQRQYDSGKQYYSLERSHNPQQQYRDKESKQLMNINDSLYAVRSSTPTRETLTKTPMGISKILSPIHYQKKNNTDDFDESSKISPIDPRNEVGFQSSTPSSRQAQQMKSAINLQNIILSPKKSTMSNEELYAVIHKSKKKMNIQNDEIDRGSPALSIASLSPGNSELSLSGRSTPIKSPETGYLGGNNSRSRYSWSPNSGDYFDFNTNIDKIPLNNSCSDRKGTQATSRLEFKKLLLQHGTKLAAPTAKKLSAVEQLKLSKQQQHDQTQLNILQLSGSPRSLLNRKMAQNCAPGSPRNSAADKSRPTPPKLMSPRSQWRFNNPRSDVLSSTILEDCREDESPNSSSEKNKLVSKFSEKPSVVVVPKGESKTTDAQNNAFVVQTNVRRQLLPAEGKLSNVEESKLPPMSRSQYIQAQRAKFFNSSPQSESKVTSSPQFIQNPSIEKKQDTCPPSPPTLETAF